MVFTFVLFKKIVTPVKSIQLVKIDNIISTTDQGINHRCKLKIELEMFMLFIWWTLQEISKITTTCNVLDDDIRIAHEATVVESCMCAFSLLYCPFIFGKTPQIPSVSIFCNPRTVEPTHTFQEQLIVVKNRILAARNKNRISQATRN
jgi:hypothetical protein